MTPYQAQELARQMRGQESARRFPGNPLATLCLHCYGRHLPPADDLCPRKSLDGKTAKHAIMDSDDQAPTQEPKA